MASKGPHFQGRPPGRLKLLLALGLLGCSLQAFATQVFFRSLEEILALGTPVVQARVVSFHETVAPGEVRILVEMDIVRSLRGEESGHRTVVHSFSTVLERPGPDGQKVRVSPIRDGSGLERSLQVGQEYFLILDDSGTTMIRAEPLSSEPKLHEAL